MPASTDARRLAQSWLYFATAQMSVAEIPWNSRSSEKGGMNLHVDLELIEFELRCARK